jgi:hypothetical protein
MMDSLISAFAGKPLAPVYTKKLKAQMDPSATRETVVWGPFKLIAANVRSNICQWLELELILDRVTIRVEEWASN